MSASSSSLPLRNQSLSSDQPKRVRKVRPTASRLRSQLRFCRDPKVDLNLHRDLLS